MQSVAAQSHKAVWLNLEYLSAEAWVAGCHGLSSPQHNLALIKHFFFPGFTRETGGLLLERDLLARRDAFLADAGAHGGDPPVLCQWIARLGVHADDAGNCGRDHPGWSHDDPPGLSLHPCGEIA